MISQEGWIAAARSTASGLLGKRTGLEKPPPPPPPPPLTVRHVRRALAGVIAEFLITWILLSVIYNCLSRPRYNSLSRFLLEEDPRERS